jgi:hypothetical protein
MLLVAMASAQPAYYGKFRATSFEKVVNGRGIEELVSVGDLLYAWEQYRVECGEVYTYVETFDTLTAPREMYVQFAGMKKKVHLRKGEKLIYPKEFLCELREPTHPTLEGFMEYLKKLKRKK